ncbi:MAG: sensor histidine kinase, partial [bacterium]
WSRLQRDKISIDNQHIPVPDLVRSVIAAYQVAAHAKNIEVVMRCPDDLQVYSDVHRTRTIVENLLNNAIKFTPQGGSIEVACTAATDGDQARTLIEVRDSGEGIPAEHLKRIFMIDEVYRTEGTAGEKGSGLGLILCRELAERLGGRVWLESEEGRGTRAYLELPAAPGDTAPART